jgi:hypothetical protein
MAKRRTSAGSRSRSSARPSARGGARKATSTRKTSRQAGARKSSATKRARKATAARKASPATRARRGAAKQATTRKTAQKKTSAALPRRRTAAPKTVPARKAPALNRPRRTVEEDDLVPTPPSSLDMNRTASAARSGRREMRERQDALTQTGPALTGGDVDADWESAYSVGDEAPGGDNPTPDQDIVDDIGKAVGVEYEDNEELKGADKVAKRDKHRWELDPASSEDYNDRD